MHRRHFVAMLRPWYGLFAASVVGAPGKLDIQFHNHSFSEQSVSTQGAATSADLEFRGVLREGNKTLFSLYDVTTGSSKWVGLNEPSNYFIVQSYDESRDVVIVSFQGRSFSLALKDAKIMPLEIGASGTIESAGDALNAVSAAKETPGRAILAEFRRRRAAWSQANAASDPQ